MRACVSLCVSLCVLLTQEIGALAWEGLFALVCYEIDMLRPKTVVDINREMAEAAEMEYAKEEVCVS